MVLHRAFQPYTILSYSRKQIFDKLCVEDPKMHENHDICLPQNGIGLKWLVLAQYSI